MQVSRNVDLLFFAQTGYRSNAHRAIRQDRAGRQPSPRHSGSLFEVKQRIRELNTHASKARLSRRGRGSFSSYSSSSTKPTAPKEQYYRSILRGYVRTIYSSRELSHLREAHIIFLLRAPPSSRAMSAG
ncbi:hypothetical protein B296_00055237 [Ensete ventricosum]|uniref:Uncharacterized protein n=1 Tax=Ensete ventricosum TaxID=4639 RepID=A0A426X3I1_ENSVE|nr:hypothetical protein B296_00055237 [Ensete ventricosum]